MNYRQRLLSIPVVAVTFFLPALFAAAPPKAKPAAKSAPAAKASKAAAAPKDWWNLSSLQTGAAFAGFLYHGTIDASYMNAQGNTHGSMFSVAADLTLRKGRYTNHFLAQHRKQDMTYGFGGGSVNMTESTIKDYLEYDLTSHVLAVAGIEHYHNSFMFIDRRLTYYAGMGSTLVENKNQVITVIGGLGYADFKFDGPSISHIDPVALPQLSTLTPTSGGALVTDSWRWVVSPKLTISQTATYMKYFNAILGHRWDLGLNAEVPLAKYVSLVPSYQIRDEVNEYTNVLGIKPQDRTFSVGLQVAF